MQSTLWPPNNPRLHRPTSPLSSFFLSAVIHFRMRSFLLLVLTAAAAHAALAPAQTEAVLGLLREHKLPQAEAAANALVAASPAEPEAYLLLGSVEIAK